MSGWSMNGYEEYKLDGQLCCDSNDCFYNADKQTKNNNFDKIKNFFWHETIWKHT